MGVSTSAKTEPFRLSDWDADRSRIDGALRTSVERLRPRLGPLAPVVSDALSSGGKRVRGLLTISAYRACGGQSDAAPIAAAVEIVHAYSLVHDDLPCMDNDVLRRGKPTAHVVHGPWAATVAGVAMVPLAAGEMYRACLEAAVPGSVARQIVARLMAASGAGGMVGGQLLDLIGETRQSTLGELERIHRGKTGALIAAAAAVGGMAAGADAKRVDALDRFGHSLGLAFQIMDDVLDVTSTSEALGKTAGKDSATGKSTYPALMGLDAAALMARQKMTASLETLDAVGLLTTELQGFARFVVERSS